MRFFIKSKGSCQIIREIKSILIRKKESNIIITVDRPRRFVYRTLNNTNQESQEESADINQKDYDGKEEPLYKVLMSFLHGELDVKSMRIDEKTSKNNNGKKGNFWLHPDVVGVKDLQEGYTPEVKSIVSSSGAKQNMLKLYSFEVKVDLNGSNLRESFFQCVSNSSWANYGYLVAKNIDNQITDELEMLCSLHVIGVIRLEVENPQDSEILIHAKEKITVDYATINRIAEQNTNFKDYTDKILRYYQTNTLIESEWYKAID